MTEHAVPAVSVASADGAAPAEGAAPAAPADASVLRTHSLAREIFTSVAGKWALTLINALAGRTLRFTELRAEVPGPGATTTDAAPLTAFIASFSSPQGLFWAKLSAASTLAIAPILIMGWFSQRQLVRGLTFGAVK